jgi:leucyl aminopeptidase (aminopeptidase T)
LDCQHLRITTASTEDRRLGSANALENWCARIASGRTFLPRLPLDRVTMLPDRQVTNGVLCASRSFPLLGGTVEGALFEFESGKVVRYDATHGKELLDLAFKFDEGARYLGEVSLVDQDVQLAQLSFATGYCGFDENAGSSILFGMGESSHLEALDMYEDAYHLQQERVATPATSGQGSVRGWLFASRFFGQR